MKMIKFTKRHKAKLFCAKYKHDIKIVGLVAFTMIALTIADIYFPVTGV